MKPLYIFNPENDLALAAGVPNYTAPASARKIRTDLQLLPMWAADGACFILAEPKGHNTAFLQDLKTKLACLDGVELYSGNCADVLAVVPWGWSLTLCEEVGRRGIAGGLSSWTEERLEELRQLSHRRVSVEIFRRLRELAPDVFLPECPKVCSSVEAVERAVGEFGTAVMKVPWSSSGRGVCRAKYEDFHLYRDWAAGILRRQGALVCERHFDKLQDFAMEFHVSGGRVGFAGYSVFSNTPQMSYDHALVASSDRLRELLSRYFEAGGLQRLQTAMCMCLESILPSYYSGYVGVDMMAYREDDGKVSINPCIELNLRMTMGVVASRLGDRVLCPDKTARMEVLYHKSQSELRDYLGALSAPRFKDGRLDGGTLLLAPVVDGANYTATLTVVG